MSGDFTSDQKRYLEGFVAGAEAMRGARPAAPVVAPPPPMGPDAAHFAAQDALTAAGKKLADQEKWKRAEHPFDAYGRLKAQARTGAFPKPDDNFRWRYFGLFYVAPTQSSYMMRLRIPNGVLSHTQFAGLADLAERYGGGYTHVTTRANLQLREIAPADATAILEAVQDLGLCSRGSGADNIRNVTGGATAGIDPQELTDTRPLAREWHFHVLNDRSLTGLPRKFNVAFDGGGRIATLEETNDIGFQAVRVGEGAGVEPGVWFRVVIGGITGHRDLARDVGVVCRAEECTAVADAIVRVFIDSGDRTDRAKARLKYVLDGWDMEKFLAAVEAKLGRPLSRVAATAIAARPPVDRAAHIGVHRQAQAGLNWIGLALPVGRMTADQMRGVAAIAGKFGDGDLRLTVWQNLLISGVALTKRLRRRRRRSKGSASTGAPTRSGPASSPAPARPAASSPPPTPRSMRSTSSSI
jgi:ferredoxin-nitrite reductase